MSEEVTQWTPGPAWLFCPADRPERYAKALQRADQVILDLEDAVAPAGKTAARDVIARLATTAQLDRTRTVVRVNAAATSKHAADLELVAAVGIERVMLAKSESVADVGNLPADVVVLCESPLGIERVSELAGVENVIAVMWGGEDLIASLGGTSSRAAGGAYHDVVRFARSRCLLAAKAHGRLALDGVHLDIADLDGLANESAEAVAIGFDAKAAIHPSQVPVIRDAYRPAPEEVAWARRLLAAAGQTQAVFTFEGRMVDRPIFRQAQRTLLRAGISGHG